MNGSNSTNGTRSNQNGFNKRPPKNQANVRDEKGEASTAKIVTTNQAAPVVIINRVDAD